MRDLNRNKFWSCNRNYHLDNIYEHFHKQANRQPNLFVKAPYEDNVFEYRSEAGALGRGSEDGLKCLNRMIESLEPHIVSSIQKRFTEGERLRNKFDNEHRGLKKTIDDRWLFCWQM